MHIRGVLLTDNDSYDEHSEQMHAYEKSVTKNPIDQFQIQDTANCARLPFVREILQPSRVWEKREERKKQRVKKIRRIRSSREDGEEEDEEK